MKRTKLKDEICNAEAVLLGLVAENPRHAYKVIKDIEDRDLQSWTELSRATIYKMLRRLELKQLVRIERKAGQGQRTRNIYHLSPAGRTALRAFLRRELSQHQTGKAPFDVAIYWSENLPLRERRDCLGEYRAQLQKAIEFWNCMVKYLADCGCPPAHQALCDRKAHMLAGELRWLDAHLRSLGAG